MNWKPVLLESVLGMLFFFPEKPDAEAVPGVKAGISGEPGPECGSSAGRSRVQEMPLCWVHSKLQVNADSSGCQGWHLQS